MKKIISFAMLALAFCACTSDDSATPVDYDPITGNKVLMLKVDYETNAFEGGTEFSFDNPTDTFTVGVQYVAPGDFGNLKLYYNELDFKLFDGDIIWMGLGELHFPQSFETADSFAHVNTNDFATPLNGFESVFESSQVSGDYDVAWANVQSLVKVRQYLQANPNATVKVFLYTPSVGIGNPADWDWFFLLKN